MSYKGIDVRETGDRLLFRVLLQDSDGALLTAGTTTLKIYELQSDGTLKSYDFNDNTFKTGALTSETQAMTHRQGNNSTTNTGLWTWALTTLTGFTAGNVYFAMVNNAGASPADQQREFQFGNPLGIGVPVALDGGSATLAGMLAKMADDNDGADFDATTDSLERLQTAVATGFPTSRHADAEPGGGTIVTGTNTANDGDSTWLNDGTYWQIAAAAAVGGFGLYVVQTFTLGVDVKPALLYINAKESLAGYVIVWAYNYTTASWDQLSDAETSITGNTDADYTYTLLPEHQQTSDGEIQIRFTSTDTATNKYLYLDQVLVNAVAVVDSVPTPAEIASAVWSNNDGHDVSKHITKYTGRIWYFDGTDGNDSNGGDYVHGAFATPTAALAAAQSGDRIIGKAGTYTDVGLDLGSGGTKSGIELRLEDGVIFTGGGSGTCLEISGLDCFVQNLRVTPGAGQIGIDLGPSYSSIGSALEDCISYGGGATGFRVAVNNARVKFTRCIAQEYTTTGFELGGATPIFDNCYAIAQSGASTIGFHLSRAATDRGVFHKCISINNGTSSFTIASGANQNLFLSCADSDTCGAISDSGTNNVFRFLGDADIPISNITQVAGVAVSGVSDFKADVSALATTAQMNLRTLLAAEYGTAANQTAIAAAIAALNDLSVAQVNAEVDTALSDYDGPTNAEMEARTLTSATYATTSALAAAAADITVIRKLRQNRLEINLTDSKAYVWNDAGDAREYEATLTDSDGDPVTAYTAGPIDATAFTEV